LYLLIILEHSQEETNSYSIVVDEFHEKGQLPDSDTDGNILVEVLEECGVKSKLTWLIFRFSD
jgi:hypothetical protein